MKALILAAGFGTRLQPHTNHIPKALFPIAGRPILDHTIEALTKAGCREITINTHHLHEEIERFVCGRNWRIPLFTRHEPEILGTAGAIKNLADFWDNQPFMVINSDILTDIDLAEVYQFHLAHPCPVTMVLCNNDHLNSVSLDGQGYVWGFSSGEVVAHGRNCVQRTFTGIQVIDPSLLDHIPGKRFYSSIDVYRDLLSAGGRIKGFEKESTQWIDIGTPERYQQMMVSRLAPLQFQRAFPGTRTDIIEQAALKGDGSDRNWFRLSSRNRSMIMADHGIRQGKGQSEAEAFVAIGKHLARCNLPVPEIYGHDPFSGLVFLQDLGDTRLQDMIQSCDNPSEIISHYKKVINLLVDFSFTGMKGFQSAWTHQTPSFDRTVILENECRYFVTAYLNHFAKQAVAFKTIASDFNHLADQILHFSVDGLMHRDLQSRNIMVFNNNYYFIDFQAARRGPIQYDLASLLIDPYVSLACSMQEELSQYCAEKISALRGIAKEDFLQGYQYCSLSRNLQMLGAFSYLSRVKKRTFFKRYIPIALDRLKKTLYGFPENEFALLRGVVE
jgi:aminoglycoside/choline kinase family phosphotransferase/choline kinase